MPHRFMQVTSINPNDTTGGGGCICDPTKQIDCQPPYIVFPGNDMESIASPHVVVCLTCAKAAVELATAGEVLAAGETSAIRAVTELVDTGPQSFTGLPVPIADAEVVDDEELPDI